MPRIYYLLWQADKVSPNTLKFNPCVMVNFVCQICLDHRVTDIWCNIILYTLALWLFLDEINT